VPPARKPRAAARVYRGEQKIGSTPFSFTGLAEGTYRVSVDAENYLKRHVEVRLTPETSGRVFRVPLYPKFIVLEGRVRPEQGTLDESDLSDLSVEVLGSRGSFQMGWHTAAARVDATGSFRLFLPRDAESTGLRLLRDSRRVASLDFDIDEMTPFDRVWQGNPVPVYTLEAVTLTSGASAANASLDLSKKNAWIFETAEKYMASGQTEDLDMAIEYFKLALEQSGHEATREHLTLRIRQAYERLFRYLYGRSLFERGAQIAGEAVRDYPGETFYGDWKGTFERENIPATSRRALAEATVALERDERRRAEEIYAELLTSGELTPFYRERVEANLADVRDVIFRDSFDEVNRCIIEGRDEQAIPVFTECLRLRSDDPFLRPIQRKLARFLDDEPPVVEILTYLREETFSCGGATNTVKIFLHEKTGLEFVLLPGGTFMMGSPSGEEGHYKYEDPQHRVTVEPFFISRTEVPQGVWDRIGGEDERHWRGSNLPIENVSWNDCIAWCKKAGLRLPTEAEWEYACRAGTKGRFCFGENESELGSYAWYSDNSGSRTHPVGQKKPNAFGIFDIHGNVLEWCQDTRHGDYSGAPTDGSAWVGEGTIRVPRGGSWGSCARFCRCAFRIIWEPGERIRSAGFRLVLAARGNREAGPFF